MNQSFMKEKEILPLVISMSLPMVISMAVNSLYNIVDSFFVAQLNENAMTALSLVFPIQNLINAIGVGFGIGINANVAYHLGANDIESANKTTTQGLILSFFHGIILTILSILGMPFFLQLFTSNAEVLEMALTYSVRAFLFSTAISIGVAFEKIFQSVGRMKVSMFSMICGFITNIILDPLMIFGIGPFPKMGIAGAAYATGIGQVISLVVYLLFYFLLPMQVKFEKKSMRLQKKFIKKIYIIGIPATFNMALPSLQISILNGILSGFSEIYVLVLGAYYKLQTFIYLSANGIIQGIRPLISYNYGAKEYKRVKRIYTTTLKLIAIIMAVGTLLSWFLPETLIGVFTSNANTIQMGVSALHIISLGFIISSVSVATSGALEALGKGMSSLYISLFRYVIIILPIAFVLSFIIGVKGVWIAFVITEFVTAAFAALMYQKYIKTV